jgi:hypothetical protein
VFSQLLHVECVQLAAAFGFQSSLPIEKQSGSKLHTLHMSAQISLSPAKHYNREMLFAAKVLGLIPDPVGIECE